MAARGPGARGARARASNFMRTRADRQPGRRDAGGRSVGAVVEDEEGPRRGGEGVIVVCMYNCTICMIDLTTLL